MLLSVFLLMICNFLQHHLQAANLFEPNHTKKSKDANDILKYLKNRPSCSLSVGYIVTSKLKKVFDSKQGEPSIVLAFNGDVAVCSVESTSEQLPPNLLNVYTRITERTSIHQNATRKPSPSEQRTREAARVAVRSFELSLYKINFVQTTFRLKII